MKIAILTQPLGHNYGGIIQAWALQQVLKNLGHEPTTIDRRADGNVPEAEFIACQLGAKGTVMQVMRFGVSILRKIIRVFVSPISQDLDLQYIMKCTPVFIDQNLRMSEPLDSTTNLKFHFELSDYDVVIVGSDQTWRPKYSPNIDNFFLDFLSGKKIKRIAYGSSFGVDEWEFTEDQTARCALLAQQFDAISVREVSGVDLCNKYLGVEATCSVPCQ
ncbi:MAG: polysaccharide pyruvyl transferase family protein [Fluviibacter sp.]